jgi:cell division transport system permease protein
MGKKRKPTRRPQGMQVVTLCISTTMVLILLGVVVLSVLTTRNLSNYVRENLTVTVMLSDSVSERGAKALARRLSLQPYAKEVTYISKEQALKEQTEAMGSDPSEFLGTNPFVASLEMRMQADYANGDSLRKIATEFRKNNRQVAEVAYQEDLTDRVNRNLQQVSVVLLALALLLIIVSYSLISNAVRLSIYSRRFAIHTMKLVGASWGFIRAPFLRSAMLIGFVAAFMACCVLGALAYGVYYYQPGVNEIVGWQELVITAFALLLSGLVITLACAYLSVNKFLRMTAGEIYKI